MSFVQQAYRAARQWYALGHERVEHAQACIVRDRAYPDVYDANFAAAVRAHAQ